MTISPTSAAAPATTSADSIPGIGQMADGLGRDAFLKLLVTQLQHQDPTKPQDDAQMLTQLSQFSSLEKLTEIATAVEAVGQLILTQIQMQQDTAK
jgi:flagellar hook assembly protein FlgD